MFCLFLNGLEYSRIEIHSFEENAMVVKCVRVSDSGPKNMSLPRTAAKRFPAVGGRGTEP